PGPSPRRSRAASPRPTAAPRAPRRPRRSGPRRSAPPRRTRPESLRDAAMKLWVDDIRRPPDDSWAWARTNEEAIEALRSGEVNEASLEHVMGVHEPDPDAPGPDARIARNRPPHPHGRDNP